LQHNGYLLCHCISIHVNHLCVCVDSLKMYMWKLCLKLHKLKKICSSGWKHTKSEPLLFKKGDVTSIIIHSKLKSWWHPLTNLNTIKKTLEFAQHFGIQSSFWVRINVDPMVRWKGLNKINVHKIYNLQCFNGHRASCLWFIKH
jgi:hypothetical protein